MPKEFYTEKDIEDMVKRGILSLQLSDDVALTDLAYEKANRLGMRLVQNQPDNPPGAPVRPYGSPPVQQVAPETAQGAPITQSDRAQLHQRIRNTVIAKMGSQLDSNLLDVIITRVLQNTGIK